MGRVKSNEAFKHQMFTSFRFCERCEDKFKPKSKFIKICDKCKIPKGWHSKSRKMAIDKIINHFENYLNIYVADDKNDCDHTFKQFKIFCEKKKYSFNNIIRFLRSKNIKCDCQIITEYYKLK